MVTGEEPRSGRPLETARVDERDMCLDAYDYGLPPDRIAQVPVEPRDASRLMVLRRGRPEIVHKTFRDLPDLLDPGDLLVVNETRVLPARLRGRRASGGKVELLLVRPQGAGWRALARPARRLRVGERIAFRGGLEGEIIAEEPNGIRVVQFFTGDRSEALEAVLEAAGEVPLPPYIRQALTDPERYQTVYAREKGSVAAPTAGLHFTPVLMQTLADRGIEMARLVLHVGPGTFRPVEVDDIREHKMDAEAYRIPEETAAAIAAARRRGSRVVAVGTTVTRALESAAVGRGHVRPGEGWTDLFIVPGFRFQVIDALITNFHLPRSTLLMLVSAFYGREPLLRAYREAVASGYRFYSFGDAMLIL